MGITVAGRDIQSNMGVIERLLLGGCEGTRERFSEIAEGMRRYGYREEAPRLAVALLEAADGFHGRLPELFAGFERNETAFPVRYDGASCPQAYAAGAPMLALRTLLGLDVRDGELVSEPQVPDQLGTIELTGVVRGIRADVGQSGSK